MYSIPAIIIANLLFWVVLIVFGAAIISSFFPRHPQIYQHGLFRPQPFEQPFYQAIKIRRWKDKLPIYRHNDNEFDRKHLSKKITAAYLELFILETCKAEMVHLLLGLLGFLSLGFTPLGIEPLSLSLPLALIMLLMHLVFVFVQRFNRQRLTKLLGRFKKP